MAGEGESIKYEFPKKGSSCLAIFSVCRGYEADAPVIRRYAIYPDTYHPDKIGSVAIYCANAAMEYAKIKNQNGLFGRRIIDMKIEMGRRPFIDVKLRV